MNKRMKIFVFMLPLLAVAAEFSLVGTTQDGRLFYQPGESAVFVIRMTGLDADAAEKPAQWKWQIKRDNEPTLNGTETFDKDKPLVLNVTLDHPGFAHIQAVPLHANGNEWPIAAPQHIFNGGVGFQPEKCNSNPTPKDFDEYWKRQKQRLMEIPLEPQITEVPSSISGSICYAVAIPCAGPAPVTGYLVVPQNATQASLPAVAVFHGYGFSRHTPPKKVDFQNAITFNINAHGMKLDMSDAEYEQLKQKLQNYAFSQEENANPDTAYFNGMALRVMRALEFLKKHPYWNGKDLIVTGGSQGGLQSIWAASLDIQVSSCLILIPWCCDLGGIEHGRYSATWRIPYTPALDYFDPAIHARRIRASVEITRAAMGDTVCPPSGVAAFFNNLQCPARIHWVQGSDHGYVPPVHVQQTCDFQK